MISPKQYDNAIFKIMDMMGNALSIFQSHKFMYQGAYTPTILLLLNKLEEKKISIGESTFRFLCELLISAIKFRYKLI